MIDAVALFEDYGAHLSQLFLHALRLDFQLTALNVWLLHAKVTHLLIALFDGLSFDPCEVLVSLTYVLVCILWQQRKVTCRDHFTEDRLRPLLSRLMLVLDLQVLRDEARSCLHDLDYFVLKNQ